MTPKENNTPLQQCVTNLIHVIRCERVAQINSADLGTGVYRQRRNLQCAGRIFILSSHQDLKKTRGDSLVHSILQNVCPKMMRKFNMNLENTEVINRERYRSIDQVISGQPTGRKGCCCPPSDPRTVPRISSSPVTGVLAVFFKYSMGILLIVYPVPGEFSAALAVIH